MLHDSLTAHSLRQASLNKVVYSLPTAHVHVRATLCYVKDGCSVLPWVACVAHCLSCLSRSFLEAMSNLTRWQNASSLSQAATPWCCAHSGKSVHENGVHRVERNTRARRTMRDVHEELLREMACIILPTPVLMGKKSQTQQQQNNRLHRCICTTEERKRPSARRRKKNRGHRWHGNGDHADRKLSSALGIQ